MRVGYDSLRGFWKEAPSRLLRPVLRSVVFSPLVSGWSSVSPLASGIKAMESALHHLARAALRGNACKKVEGEVGQVFKYEAMANSAVLEALGLAPHEVELRISRLFI